MKNSYTSLGIIVAAVVVWAGYNFSNEFASGTRASQRERSVLGEEFSSPSRTPRVDVAARGPIAQKAFDIKNFESADGKSPKGKEEKTVHRSLREMQRLLKCFESETCNFDQSTAQSYRTALRENLKEEMMNFEQLIENDNYSDPSLVARAQDITRFFLTFPDDDIKDEAISLASLLPISNQTGEALIAGLSDSSSAPLYEKGIQELKRYIGTGEKAHVDAFLVQSLVSGSSYVSKLVARESLAFISSDNTQKFVAVLNQLPRRSQEFEMLKANVDESRRL